MNWATNRCQRNWNDFSINTDKNFHYDCIHAYKKKISMHRKRWSVSTNICSRLLDSGFIITGAFIVYFFLFWFLIQRVLSIFIFFFFCCFIPIIVIVHSYWQNQMYSEMNAVFLTKCNKVTFFIENVFIVFTCIRETLKQKKKQ